jgi:hypothetical protein
MMHSFEGLANYISTLLKNRGDTGDRGDKLEKASRNNLIAVTPCRASVSPLEIAIAGDEFPAEWHAILAELEGRESPDWMMPDRWEILLRVAERFLDLWSPTAHAMGWTTLDLFGTHPTRPAVRFDVMGLLLLLQGGEVIALTAEGVDQAAQRSCPTLPSPGRWRRPSVGGGPCLRSA